MHLMAINWLGDFIREPRTAPSIKEVSDAVAGAEVIVSSFVQMHVFAKTSTSCVDIVI